VCVREEEDEGKQREDQGRTWYGRSRTRALRGRTPTPRNAPDDFHVAGLWMMELSTPTTSSRPWTNSLHHRSLTLRLISHPSGP
jgi:hypothetical protein